MTLLFQSFGYNGTRSTPISCSMSAACEPVLGPVTPSQRARKTGGRYMEKHDDVQKCSTR
jgi:hypothetical protein